LYPKTKRKFRTSAIQYETTTHTKPLRDPTYSDPKLRSPTSRREWYNYNYTCIAVGLYFSRARVCYILFSESSGTPAQPTNKETAKQGQYQKKAKWLSQHTPWHTSAATRRVCHATPTTASKPRLRPVTLFLLWHYRLCRHCSRRGGQKLTAAT
jgi:hypothetical protein